MWEKQLCRATRVSEGGGAGGLQEPEQRFPCSPGAAHGEASVPLQPMEINRGAKIHPQPLEFLWSRQMFDGVYNPMGSLLWSRIRVESVALWREDPVLVLAGLVTPIEGAHSDL